MKNRCSNPNVYAYQWYGGRGVRVCERWRNSFQAFLEDMGQRPNGMTIDRKDTNANYSCGKCEECLRESWTSNCRWATWAEQHSNRRPFGANSINLGDISIGDATDTIALGLQLRCLRIGSGLSLRNVADTVDANISTISRLERGLHSTSVGLLFKLLSLYDAHLKLERDNS